MKFFTRLFVSFNVFVFMDVAAFGVPAYRDATTTQKYFHSLNQQNLNAILMSIDNRLQNLDQLCSLHSETIQSKLAYYENKLDKMEKEILRIEMRIKIDLDKVSENISKINFRDDSIANRIIKKIDSAFDRVSNKYAAVETNMDLIATKLQNTRDIVIEKLDKIDESLYIRDEENAAEMEDVIEDVKKVCSSVEDKLFNKTQYHIKSISNRTKIPTNGHHYNEPFQLAKLLHENSNPGNQPLSNCGGIEKALDKNKADIEISINDFTNKVTDMKYNLDEALADFKISLENVVSLVNETRKEQQNNFKELRVGRKNSNKYVSDNEQLSEISNKIDKHFKRLISAQNAFSDNCYKLQMDESQIETKISFVLEKMIETFENKTTLKPEDITKLENSLFVHDMYIRRHFYELAKKINMLSKKMSDDRNNTIYNVKQSIVEEHEMLEEVIRNLENTINATFFNNKTLENTLLMVNENLKNILKFMNYTTTDSKSNISNTFAARENNYSLAESYITEMIFSYTTEESIFPDVNFPIDVRFGTDDSIKTNINSNNYNDTIKKNYTEAKINNTFSVDLESYSTEDLNLTESKMTTNSSSNNKTVKVVLPSHTKRVSNSQTESEDENSESYLSNRSDYDLELVQSILNNKDHTERSETDYENEDSVETHPRKDIVDFFREWLEEN